jgi:hypothetical protein
LGGLIFGDFLNFRGFPSYDRWHFDSFVDFLGVVGYSIHKFFFADFHFFKGS